MEQPETFRELLEAYQRVDNILSGSELPDRTIDADLFEDDVEATLFQAVNRLDEFLETELTDADPERVFEELTALVTPINEFFETVLVNAEDEAVKQNRLKLLRNLRTTMKRIADFSKINPKDLQVS